MSIKFYVHRKHKCNKIIMTLYDNNMPIYNIPTFDPQANLRSSSYFNDDQGNNILTTDKNRLLGNSDKWTFEVEDIKKVFLSTTHTINNITDIDARDLFMKWISEFNMAIWRPIKRKSLNFNINRLRIELDGTKDDKPIFMRNLRMDKKSLETGDIIYVMPPLLSLTASRHHSFAIEGEFNNIFVHPMLLTNSDYEHYLHDCKLVSLYADNLDNLNLKEVGRSPFKKYLMNHDMLELAKYLPKLKKLGVVQGPIDYHQGFISSNLTSGTTISYNEMFKLKYKVL